MISAPNTVDADNASNIHVGNAQLASSATSAVQSTDLQYSSSRAVSYANAFVHNNNPYFYSTTLNCTNFVSQAVSYRFGSTTGYSSPTSFRMVSGTYTSGWFAGSGGGSGPWENVTRNWDYMISGKVNLNGPRVNVTNWAGLLDGGVVQIDFNSDGRFDHSAICVNRASGIFAQNTQNTYRFHQEYIGPKRYYNPSFFRVH